RVVIVPRHYCRRSLGCFLHRSLFSRRFLGGRFFRRCFRRGFFCCGLLGRRLRRGFGGRFLGGCFRPRLCRARLELETYLAVGLLDQVGLELSIRAARNKAFEQIGLAFGQQFA